MSEKLLSPCCQAELWDRDCVYCEGAGERMGDLCHGCGGDGIDDGFLQCGKCFKLFIKEYVINLEDE